MPLSFIYILLFSPILAQSDSNLSETASLNAENLENHEKEDRHATDHLTHPPAKGPQETWSTCTVVSDDEIKPLNGALSPLTSPTSTHSDASASSTRALPTHSPTRRD